MVVGERLLPASPGLRLGNLLRFEASALGVFDPVHFSACAVQVKEAGMHHAILLHSWGRGPAELPHTWKLLMRNQQNNPAARDLNSHPNLPPACG